MELGTGCQSPTRRVRVVIAIRRKLCMPKPMSLAESRPWGLGTWAWFIGSNQSVRTLRIFTYGIKQWESWWRPSGNSRSARRSEPELRRDPDHDLSLLVRDREMGRDLRIAGGLRVGMARSGRRIAFKLRRRHFRKLTVTSSCLADKDARTRACCCAISVSTPTDGSLSAVRGRAAPKAGASPR